MTRDLRKELEAQDAPPSETQQELERRYRRQEAEREKREAVEAQERAEIENALSLRSGFQHQR